MKRRAYLALVAGLAGLAGCSSEEPPATRAGPTGTTTRPTPTPPPTETPTTYPHTSAPCEEDGGVELSLHAYDPATDLPLRTDDPQRRLVAAAVADGTVEVWLLASSDRREGARPRSSPVTFFAPERHLPNVQLMVHFAVGLFGGLLVLTVVDLPPRREFLLMIASGFWAAVPDGHWLVLEVGLVDVAAAWKAFHRTAWANLFWFHGIIDGLETGRNNLEAGIALAILLVVAVGYALLNDWSAD